METKMPQTVHVNKNALTEISVVEDQMRDLAQGAVRLRIQSFAVTANNITYAVIGDLFKYWNFFPASGAMGVVPMWGHAVVEASNHADVAVGERVYGYLPMATHLDVKPGKVSAGQFTDMSDHRQPMSPFYNQYSRLAADPEHDPAREEARMLFGPLFKTGFLIENMFDREGWYRAKQLVMTSASSKTSLALAYCAKEKSPGVKRIGLTSPANIAFVRRTGLYDEVIGYDALDSIAKLPSVSVDFAGNAAVLAALHNHLGDELKYSCLVGATHVGARGAGFGGASALPGATPTLFFAPDHATATITQLGPKGFAEAVAVSWNGFVQLSDGLIRVDHRDGLQAAADAFLDTLRGTADPAVGIVVRP
jgi:Protein of unknown function (DUF2855)